MKQNRLNRFFDLSEKFKRTANLLNTQIPVIQETASFAEHLKAAAHIDDVDFMWDDINKAKENFGTIENSLQNIEADILKMQKHLDEIDSFVAILNNELDTLATTSAEHKEAIATLFKNLADAEEYAVDSRNLITELEAFRAEVSALNHLMEVDKIWEQTEDHQIRINRVGQEGKSHTDKLSGISHLDDVDSIWKDVEKHTSKFVECERRDEDLAVTIQKNKEEVNENIAEAVQTANAAIEFLTKKVKYAYWIAGGLAGLAIIELILLLMKVI